MRLEGSKDTSLILGRTCEKNLLKGLISVLQQRVCRSAIGEIVQRRILYPDSYQVSNVQPRSDSNQGRVVSPQRQQSTRRSRDCNGTSHYRWDHIFFPICLPIRQRQCLQPSPTGRTGVRKGQPLQPLRSTRHSLKRLF